MPPAGVTLSMLRALAIFAAAAALFLGVGWFSRTILHLDCVGPYIDGWGCLSTPYPAVLPGSSALLFDLGVAVAGFLACLAVRDLVWSLGGRLAALLFPGWARRTATRTTRGYPVR